MKKLIKLLQLIIFSGIFLGNFVSVSTAQDSKKERQAAKMQLIKNIVDTQNFIFVPRSVTPLRGGTRQLTSYYQVTITKDTLVSYLPYFGRAYSATYNARDNALDFTSINFDYSEKAGKKGSREILIKPKDQTSVQQFLFTIYENGNAFLNVTNVNRDAISYQGYVTKRKRK